MAAAPKPDIDLYTVNTPNGVKVSILLEELGLPYKIHPISFSKNEQKEPWFLEINPNGRIPALTDTFTDGSKIRLFESGSMMQYLVDRYDPDHKVSYPRGSREYYETNNWLFFQMGGLGPMQGQANHFTRYAPEKIPYGINRYVNETRRLYSVLETHLDKAGTDYIVGGKCTIADMSCWGWVVMCSYIGISLDDYPKLKAWAQRVQARPAVERGCSGAGLTPFRPTKTEEEMAREAEAGKAWIQRGMAEDAKK